MACLRSGERRRCSSFLRRMFMFLSSRVGLDLKLDWIGLILICVCASLCVHPGGSVWNIGRRYVFSGCVCSQDSIPHSCCLQHTPFRGQFFLFASFVLPFFCSFFLVVRFKFESILFNAFQHKHAQTGMMRYLQYLASKDLSLATAMIPLGSCTMKLNSALVMQPLEWPSISSLHPFAPDAQTAGMRSMIRFVEDSLCNITQLSGCTLMVRALL